MKREELVRLAQAELERLSDSPEHGFHGGPDDWTPYAEAALTAILAGLREPSEEMVNAAERVDLSEIEGIGQEYPMAQMLNRSDIASIWQAMLSTLDDRSTGGEG